MNDRVYRPSDLKNYIYFEKDKSFRDKIDPKRIIGVEYAYGYNCPNIFGEPNIIYWKSMLHKLKRLDRVIDNYKSSDELIAHIHKDKDSKAVFMFGGFYFTISGQHRLCLAKYLEIPEVEVNITEYKFNKKLFIREKKVEKYYCKLKELKLIDLDSINEIDNNYIHIRLSKETIFLNKIFCEYLVKRYELIKEKRYKSFSNILKSFFKPQNNGAFYNNPTELYALDHLIIKHLKSRKATSNKL